MRFIKLNLVALHMMLTIIGLLFLLLPSVQAQPTVLAPVTTSSPNYYIQDTNATPLVLTNGQFATFPANGTNSLEKTLRQDHGLSLFATVISTNPLSVGSLLNFDVTGDGTVYTANHPVQWFVPSNFIGTNTYWTNIPPTTANNFRQIQFTGASNSITGVAGAAGSNTNSITLKLFYSQSTAAP